MALSGFEIAMGGITSIPVVGGLVFLGYKSFGESSLDASKLKPKQKTTVKKETPAPDKKEIKEKPTTTTAKKSSQSETQKPTVKKETPALDKKEIKEKSQQKKPEDKTNITIADKTPQREL